MTGRGDLSWPRLERERGAGLLLAMALVVAVSTISAAVLLAVSTESRLAVSFQHAIAGAHAADAAAELALADLAATADWNRVLDGTLQASFIDGAPGGTRTLEGHVVDLDRLRHELNCARASPCSEAELDAVTALRPWGINNPRWRPYAYGPLARASTGGDPASRFYVVVFVGDDPAETDGDPSRDAAAPTDPGNGVVLMRAEALGAGSRRAVELTVVRAMAGAAGPQARVLSWKRVT